MSKLCFERRQPRKPKVKSKTIEAELRYARSQAELGNEANPGGVLNSHEFSYFLNSHEFSYFIVSIAS